VPQRQWLEGLARVTGAASVTGKKTHGFIEHVGLFREPLRGRRDLLEGLALPLSPDCIHAR
jgi:hypothetical protein